MELNVVLDPGAYMPERSHATDAGADLRTRRDITINPHSNGVVDTGVHVEIPDGFVGMLKTKSGINLKKDCTTEGVIDSGYTGSIVVKIYNHGEKIQTFEAGDKITQLVIVPVSTPLFKQVDTLDPTERGDGGFGSTGK